MPRPRKSSTLEAQIQTLATTFAREVVGALRTVSLSEIASLSAVLPQAVRKVRAAVASAAAPAPAAPAKKKRRILNFPKCAWAGCGKNRSPRTSPYCGEHYRAVKAGQTPPPGSLGTGVPIAPATQAKAPAGVRVAKGKRRRAA
jgi:hypothetical protein